ncbi:putative 3-beta hydroxysteroid dehydrogenase [Paratrimastix pyriformis]|uniref:3-beta hydroxysteroid dehydrogenase n=1 Tax=Paratrimastix pyriformis TaxID=342808 RepID=A0ABQ8UQW1_9EUKA|nr:putative 3-beta hydroxysteroid dehydrogenase [Paratrimastix pyriformis]
MSLVVAITGGCGFLGQHLANHIAMHWPEVKQIRLLDLVPPRPGVVPSSPKFEFIRTSLTDLASLEEALRGVNVCYHLAAKVDWGQASMKTLWDINVRGTQNVVNMCTKTGVRALVSTGSIEAVLDHRRSGLDLAETTPHSLGKTNTTYGRSKAHAEMIVLRSNAPGILNTAVIRPLAMYGPGDPWQCPSFIRSAKSVVLPPGLMIVRIGDGKAVFHSLYVENGAHGLLLLGQRVWAEANGQKFSEPASGQLFNVTDEPANNLFDRYFPIMEGVCNDIDQTIPAWDTAPLCLGMRMAEMPPVPALSLPAPTPGKWRFKVPTRRIPFALAYLGAILVELVFWALGFCPPLRRRIFPHGAPPMNRVSTTLIVTPISVNGDKIRRVLGYAPVVTQAEAYRRTIGWFRQLAKAKLPLTGGLPPGVKPGGGGWSDRPPPVGHVVHTITVAWGFCEVDRCRKDGLHLLSASIRASWISQRRSVMGDMLGM